MCTCNKAEIDAFLKEVGPRKFEVFDSRRYKGERIIDSFGFRMRIPGECDECWQKYVDNYEENHWTSQEPL